jgi:hypothetical protein
MLDTVTVQDPGIQLICLPNLPLNFLGSSSGERHHISLARRTTPSDWFYALKFIRGRSNMIRKDHFYMACLCRTCWPHSSSESFRRWNHASKTGSWENDESAKQCRYWATNFSCSGRHFPVTSETDQAKKQQWVWSIHSEARNSHRRDLRLYNRITFILAKRSGAALFCIALGDVSQLCCSSSTSTCFEFTPPYAHDCIEVSSKCCQGYLLPGLSM